MSILNKPRLVRTFKKLVEIDSISLQEGKIVNFLQKELRTLGIHSFQLGRVSGGEVGNLIANVPGDKLNRPCLLLNAHLDTVSPGRKVKVVERKDYIYSDGTTVLGADDKAGVAAIMEILRVLKERHLQHPPLKVVFTVAEEIGLLGAKALPPKSIVADLGLVLDGGDINKIIYKAPSQYNLTAVVIGKAAHAGIHPEEGINAIKIASLAISRMRLGRIDQETTANIGLIEGGRATNIVPDRVEIKGETRSHNLRKLERQVEHMKEALFRTCQKYRAKVELKVEKVYRAFEVDPKGSFVSFVSSVIKKQGIVPVIEKTGGGSDANIFNSLGVPTLILGVGADRVHTTRERICVNDLIKGTESVLNIILEAGNWKKS